jgi:hypothetical protein
MTAREAYVGEVELVLVVGGAWCALLGFVVALMAVGSGAEQRPDREVTGRDRPLVRAWP